MVTALDTNILLDLLIPQVPHQQATVAALDASYQQGALVISEGVYAELGSQFESARDLDAFLHETRIRLERSTMATFQFAGEIWQRYTRRRGKTLTCPSCGWKGVRVCPRCDTSLPVRQHVLMDFLIGSHALQQADYLLTRDRGYYRTYFPTLRLKVPQL